MINPTFTSTEGFYRAKVTDFTGQTDWVKMPAGMSLVSVAIHPGAGATSYVEYTLSTQAEINAGTAYWMVWDAGQVTDSASDALISTATAIRAFSIGGTSTLEVISR